MLFSAASIVTPSGVIAGPHHYRRAHFFWPLVLLPPDLIGLPGRCPPRPLPLPEPPSRPLPLPELPLPPALRSARGGLGGTGAPTAFKMRHCCQVLIPFSTSQ